MRIAVLDKDKKIVNILEAPYIFEDNQAICHDWLNLGDTYTDIEPDGHKLSRLKAAKLAEIKAALKASDYKQAKYLDGELTVEEYTPIKAERQSARVQYNLVEATTTLAELEAVTND